MLTAGNMRPYLPQFFSLSPSEHPLPSCLEGTKNAINRGAPNREPAALFPGIGNADVFRAMLDFLLYTFFSLQTNTLSYVAVHLTDGAYAMTPTPIHGSSTLPLLSTGE